MNFIKIIQFYILLNPFFIGISYGQKVYSETGNASYYASNFHGKKTASGEKYDMNMLTAAHNSLPFNTYVKVTNLSNNKCVVVKINDRGPHSKNRIIDLSSAAAKKINLIQSGVARVKIEVLPSPEEKNIEEKEEEKDKIATTTEVTKLDNLKNDRLYTISGTEVKCKGYVVQLASFSDTEKLNIQIEKMKPHINTLYVETAKVNSTKVYRILSGNFSTKESAQKELEKLQSIGYNGFVRKF